MDYGQNSIKNWQELQRSLIKQFPLPAESNGIEKLVHKTIKNFMQHSMPHQSVYDPFSAEEGVEYELFESQRVIFVRCKVPDKTSNHDIRFFANKYKLKIEYLGNTQEIRLPSDVSPAQAYARMDGDVVEVLLPKSRDNEPYHEISIRDQ
ncbi:hypothetical protein [Paenibacillus sp. RC67]|uniref:hypothetical protein n=1 Tax=Paenibacillus sp. RC67 TaxID=3039392 RepID=UPI0024ADCC0F|nr:hypothetical protein [Paenibacillus sp. RC67]